MSDTTELQLPNAQPHPPTEPQQGPQPGSWRHSLGEFWFYFRANRGAVIGLVVFVLLVVLAILAPLIAPHSPTNQYRDALLVPPAWTEGGRPEFWLGTDAVGRDMLSRLLYGLINPRIRHK